MAGTRTPRQREIVAATRGIIIAGGMRSLTVRAIADELNMTDGALYRHFRSKNEIISLLIDDIEETLLRVINDAAGRQENAVLKLKKVFLSHFSYIERRQGISFLVINEVLSLRDMKLKRKMYGVLKKYLDTIKGILAQGVRGGDFGGEINTDTAAIVFFGMIQSLVTLRVLSGYRLALNLPRLERMFDLFNKGIMKRAF